MRQQNDSYPRIASKDFARAAIAKTQNRMRSENP